MSQASRPEDGRRRTVRLLIGIAFALAVVAPGAPSSAQSVQATPASFPPDSAILAIMQERVEQGRSAGLVIGLLEADGSTRVLAYGDPGPGKPPLDAESVFEIGSITKVFTGTVLADMTLKGEVSLDDPVQQYLPPGVTMPTRSGMEITLGMLAEQNSGLPRMPANFAPADPSNPYVDYDAELLYEFLSRYELPRDPGESFEYSNLGVGLLGHVLALHAGTSYEELVRDRILEPLGMTHTGVTLTPWMREHLALGHGPGGGVVSNWDLDALAGAGALRSTAEDMLRFLEAALHPERGPVHQALAFAQEERADAGRMRIGLNWIAMDAAPDTIIWHNGGTAGYRTFIGMVPSRSVGVVVLTNSGGAGADDVGRHLLHPDFPLAPLPNPLPRRLGVLGVVLFATVVASTGVRWVRRRQGAKAGRRGIQLLSAAGVFVASALAWGLVVLLAVFLGWWDGPTRLVADVAALGMVGSAVALVVILAAGLLFGWKKPGSRSLRGSG